MKHVSQPDALVNCPDLVEAVRPFSEHLKAEIDLGKSARFYSFVQGMREDDVQFSKNENANAER